MKGLTGVLPMQPQGPAHQLGNLSWDKPWRRTEGASSEKSRRV